MEMLRKQEEEYMRQVMILADWVKKMEEKNKFFVFK